MQESKNAVAIKVHTRLKAQQHDVVEEFETIEIGQLFKKSGSIFIKYEEKISIDEQKHSTSVLVKITGQKSVEIVRSGASRMKLRFVLGEDVPSSLQSGHGAMSLITRATRLNHEEIAENQGNLSLNYELYGADELIGNYEFVLSYK